MTETMARKRFGIFNNLTCIDIKSVCCNYPVLIAFHCRRGIEAYLRVSQECYHLKYDLASPAVG